MTLSLVTLWSLSLFFLSTLHCPLGSEGWSPNRCTVKEFLSKPYNLGKIWPQLLSDFWINKTRSVSCLHLYLPQCRTMSAINAHHASSVHGNLLGISFFICKLRSWIPNVFELWHSLILEGKGSIGQSPVDFHLSPIPYSGTLDIIVTF